MPSMRAKVYVSHVSHIIDSKGEKTQESLEFHAVAKSGSYPADGLDEDNTFAKFSPYGQFKLTVANPALFGKFLPGQRYYVDFSPAE